MYSVNHQNQSNGKYITPKTVKIFVEVNEKIEIDIPTELLSSFSSNNDDPVYNDDNYMHNVTNNYEILNSKSIKDWIFKNHYDQMCDMISIAPCTQKSKMEIANRRLLLLDKVTQAQRGFLEQQKVCFL